MLKKILLTAVMLVGSSQSVFAAAGDDYNVYGEWNLSKTSLYDIGAFVDNEGNIPGGQDGDEYIFFVHFIDEEIKRLEETQSVQQVTESFDRTFAEFMEDGVLDEHEYKMLIKFLKNMKSALPADVYYTIQKKINDVHNKSKDN